MNASNNTRAELQKQCAELEQKRLEIERRLDFEKHINLLGAEFATSTGVRAIAAEICLMEEPDLEHEDELYFAVSDLVGYDANQEGYIDSYEVDEDGNLPESLFGYGMSLSSHEAYLSLHEHFGGLGWIQQALTVYLSRPDNAVDDISGTVRSWMESALAAYKLARAKQKAAHLAELCTKLKEIANEVELEATYPN